MTVVTRPPPFPYDEHSFYRGVALCELAPLPPYGSTLRVLVAPMCCAISHRLQPIHRRRSQSPPFSGRVATTSSLSGTIRASWTVVSPSGDALAPSSAAIEQSHRCTNVIFVRKTGERTREVYTAGAPLLQSTAVTPRTSSGAVVTPMVAGKRANKPSSRDKGGRKAASPASALSPAAFDPIEPIAGLD